MNRHAIGVQIRLAGLVLTGLVLVGCSSVASMNILNGDELELDCAVGDVTPHEAVVWMKTTETQQVVVQYTSDPLWTSYQETGPEQVSDVRDFTIRVELPNLQSETRYFVRGLIHGRTPTSLCQFVTAPGPDTVATVTFVIGGDTRHSHLPFSIMQAMREDHPDFFVYLGDTIYSDKERPAYKLPDYWAKYRENRDGFLKQLFAEVPVYAMWDDHEVDDDFVSTHGRLTIGRQAFFDFWPIRPDAQEPGRLYRSFSWGKGVDFFLLDTRQYRNPETQTMLGEEQKQWLLKELGASQAAVKFILSSVPFSDPRKDKWGEYPGERDEIFTFIRERAITGVVFLAGDVHHGAVSRMPGLEDMKEFIFGPLAAPMNDKVSPNEPRFEFFYDKTPNYGKITVSPEEVNPMVRIEWLDARHQVIHGVVVENGQYHSFGP
ncbi:MAG: alkaline phosphatase [Nitrospirales bacterium]